MAEKDERVGRAGREGRRRGRGDDPRDAAVPRGRMLEAHRGGLRRERGLGDGDELREGDRPGLGGVGREPELLQALGRRQDGREDGRRLGRDGRGGVLALHERREELGGRGPESAAHELARGGRHLQGGVPLGRELLEQRDGGEQAVGAPGGVERAGAGGADVGDLREEEVRELARRPPGHVGERHAHAALHRLRGRPGAGELGEARDGADKLEVGAAALGLAHGEGELRAHRDPAREEARRELAPRGGGVRRHDDDLGRPLAREARDLPGDELRARRGAGGQQHAHGARRAARGAPGPEERVEKGAQLARARDGGASVARPGLPGLDAARAGEPAELRRERLAPGERGARARPGHDRHLAACRKPNDELAHGPGHLGKPREDHPGGRDAPVREHAGEARHDLALLDEAGGRELLPVGAEKPRERALRRRHALGRRGVGHPGQAAAREAGEQRGGAGRHAQGACGARGGAGEDARADDLARDGVCDAPAVPPHLPALLGPGGGGGDGDAEREAARGERALGVERLGEARDEQRGAPARLERLSQRPLDDGSDEGLLGCSHDMQRHAVLTARRFFSPEIVAQRPDGNDVTPRRRCARGPSGSRLRGR